MTHARSASFVLSVLVAVLFLQPETTAQSMPDKPGTVTAAEICGTGKTYDELTNAARLTSPPKTIPGGIAPVELTISSTEFDSRPVSPNTAPSLAFCWRRTLWDGVSISTAAEVYSFLDGEGAERHGHDKVSAENFARLEQLIDELPDDAHSVPPPSRRITVSAYRHGVATVRLYDSRNLPDEIIEMIRVSGARIKVQTPVFQPDKVWNPEGAKHLGLPDPENPYWSPCISPDGSLRVIDNPAKQTLTVYEGSNWPSVGLPPDVKVIHVIPEFWLSSMQPRYVANSSFSPDGHYLLVKWGVGQGALLYDTQTWQPITDPHLFPQNLKEYLPSLDWNLGIAVTVAGETLIWSQKTHRVLSELKGANGVRLVAFSPDNTRVAVWANPDGVRDMRLSVWAVESGQELRDCWPVEWLSFPSGQPIWWDSGRLLLAPFAGRYAGRGIGLWDAETGRFKGTLGGFDDGCQGFESLITTNENLYARCSIGKEQNGEVLEWTVQGVREQMKRDAIETHHADSNASD